MSNGDVEAERKLLHERRMRAIRRMLIRLTIATVITVIVLGLEILGVGFSADESRWINLTFLDALLFFLLAFWVGFTFDRRMGGILAIVGGGFFIISVILQYFI